MIGLRHEYDDENQLHAGPYQQRIERPPPVGRLIDETAYKGPDLGSKTR